MRGQRWLDAGVTTREELLQVTKDETQSCDAKLFAHDSLR